jgi:hypothetical protein
VAPPARGHPLFRGRGSAPPIRDLAVEAPGESFLGEGCAEPVAADALQRLPIVGRNALRGVKGEPRHRGIMSHVNLRLI